eukprot:502008-Rhodomonas_salina.5
MEESVEESGRKEGKQGCLREGGNVKGESKERERIEKVREGRERTTGPEGDSFCFSAPVFSGA